MITTDITSVNTREAPNCELCGSVGTIMHQQLIDRLFGAPGVWNLRRCSNQNCELFWTDPQPLPSDIWKFYQNYWTHSGKPAPNAELSTGAKRAAKSAAAILLFWRRSALLSDSRYLSRRRPGRLLDVGCGGGDFLAGMSGIGWDATGVDFDEQAVASARNHRGIKVFAGGLAEQNFSDNSFDAITLSNVIEHVPDPLATFAELKRILAPGGRIVIVTPNPNSLGHRSFGRCWRGLEPPRHLFLFTPRTLKSCATVAGLRTTACFSSVGAASGILKNSHELWHQFPRSKAAPNLAGLHLRQRLFTLFNAPVGEFSVLLASK